MSQNSKLPADSVKEMGPDDVSKPAIRDAVWKYIEECDLADFPRPVYRRIPNVKGAATAAELVPTMQEFKRAQTVKINPDKPQEQARFLTLDAGKNLLVPTPRLRAGLFNKITPPEGATKDILRICSTSQGVREYSKTISLDDKVKIDLVIIGSVAVSKTGLRIGKGEGFADLEWAMMMSMGAVTKDTIVITTVHDCQIVDIPESLIEEHDLTVDYIVTPSGITKCNNNRSKPTGIIWSKLEHIKLKRVPVLRKLMLREKEAGKDVRLKDGEEFDVEAAEKEDQEREERRQQEDEEDGQNRRRREKEAGKDVRLKDGEEFDIDAAEKEDQEREERRQQEDEEDGQNRRRRFNRYRRGPFGRFRGRGRGRGGRGGSRGDRTESEGADGEENEDRDGEDGEGKPQRRPNRRFRRRNAPRRSKDAEGEDEGGRGDEGKDDDEEGKKKNRRPMRRFRPRRGRQPSLFVGGLPRSLRVSTFKTEVRGRDVDPLRVIWHGGNGHAFLQFENQDLMESALKALDELNINGKKLRVEEARQSRNSEEKDEQNGEATEGERQQVETN